VVREQRTEGRGQRSEDRKKKEGMRKWTGFRRQTENRLQHVSAPLLFKEGIQGWFLFGKDDLAPSPATFCIMQKNACMKMHDAP
jgi:hypothetical protein